MTQVSYLEIYNEHGFDLLNQHQDIKQMEDLPKVRTATETMRHGLANAVVCERVLSVTHPVSTVQHLPSLYSPFALLSFALALFLPYPFLLSFSSPRSFFLLFFLLSAPLGHSFL